MPLPAQSETTAAVELPNVLGVDDALALAVRLHHAGGLDDAEKLYRRILEAAPDHPDALHYLGVLVHQRGDSDAGIELIRRSIRLGREEPDRFNNLGNVLVERGSLDEAADAYLKAIALDPHHANAHGNLGAVRKAQRRFDESYAAYRRAIELDPAHADAYNNLGNLLSSQGKVKEAVACYCKAITVTPNHPEARKLLGIAYYTLGEIDKAAAIYREWLAEEPANPIARHLLAACSGEGVPDRASDTYVETTFDVFAQSFDAKLERLGYRAPQIVADALVRAGATPDKRLDALDAGCGTGLCGPLLAPYVRRLTGVDLSAKMLAEAEKRGAYDALVKGELTAFLAAHPDEFDAIVSADTLVYFGALDAPLAAAARALRAGGVLVFTVEAAAEAVAGYRINPHGRYSHTPAYVRDAMARAGLAVPAIEPATLRSEGGVPVAGLVVTGRRTNRPPRYA